MKAGWQFFKFGEVCELRKGRKPLLHAAQGPGFKPYLIARYLRGSECAEFASEGDKNSISVAANEIIVICDGSNSGETFIGFDGILSSTMAKIVHGDTIDTRFLLHYLGSLFEQFSSTKTGSAIPHLDLPALRQQLIPVPPLPEQQRIVTLLDEAFDGIATAKANAEKNLQNARAIFESHLQSVFSETRNMVSLADIAIDITDGDHMPPPKATAGVHFITISNILKRTRGINFENTFLVPPEYFAQLKPNRRPRLGDVLYTVTGATLGIPVLVDHHTEFCFQRHIALIRPRPGINSVWLSYLMSSPQVFAQATSGATGAAQKTVSLTVLRNIMVPRHSEQEQVTVAAQLSKLFAQTYKLEDLYNAKVSTLDDLKKSLLHRAFNGDL